MTPVMTFQLASGLRLLTSRFFLPGKKSSSVLACVPGVWCDVDDAVAGDGCGYGEAYALPAVVEVDAYGDGRDPLARGAPPTSRSRERPRSSAPASQAVAPSSGLPPTAADSVSPSGLVVLRSRPAGGVGGWRSADASSSSSGKPDVAPCHFLGRGGRGEGRVSARRAWAGERREADERTQGPTSCPSRRGR